jgi:predicted ATPase
MMATHVLAGSSTGFVGRNTELTEITQLLLDPACRLLTLLGPGGIGKTRLAVETASHVLHVFPDGSYFVPLQPLSSPDFIASTLAKAIHFHSHNGGDFAEQLLDYLRDKTMLLVLDNFEHLLEGTAVASDILAAAPGVKLLATSRERLNLLEEWVYEVRGLDFPSSDGENAVEQYGAVQLFVHSARRVHHSFQLTPSNKLPVARICRLVGGMPLGVELASAWVRVLPCQAIAEEIQHSLDILETPARNVPSRHRNMRAAFEPTWNRLSDEEQCVFKKLAVFRGGFTREAAEYVANATLQMLSALIDRSLLRLDANDRYDIHELLRQYGEEILRSSPALYEQTLELHRAYYMHFLSEREREIAFLGRPKDAIRKMNKDLENVRSAWRRAVEQGCFQDISQAAEGLWTFF